MLASASRLIKSEICYLPATTVTTTTTTTSTDTTTTSTTSTTSVTRTNSTTSITTDRAANTTISNTTSTDPTASTTIRPCDSFGKKNTYWQNAGNEQCCSNGGVGFCAEGEGDCDADSECQGDLVCGNDNCAWGNGDDCCEKLPTTATTTTSTSQSTATTARSEYCPHDYGRRKILVLSLSSINLLFSQCTAGGENGRLGDNLAQ